MNPLKNMIPLNNYLEKEIDEELTKLLISDNLESRDYRESLPRLYIGEIAPDKPKTDDFWFYNGSEASLYEYYDNEWLYMDKVLYLTGRSYETAKSWAYVNRIYYPNYKVLNDNNLMGVRDGLYVNLDPEGRLDERLYQSLEARGWNEIDGRSPQERLNMLEVINNV